MKRHWLHIAIIMFAFLSMSAVAQDKSSAVEEFSVKSLKVIMKANTANDIISAQLYLRGGCLNITENTQGIEPLMFGSAIKGSKKYPKEKLNAILDKTASGIGSYSGRDYAAITLRCLKSDFNSLWNVFADVVMNPAFVSEDVEIVRKNMLLGIKQRKDNPDGYLRELADEVFYTDHPYRLDPNGVESSVSAITIDQMRKHLNDNLVTSKLLLVVVGNVKKSDLMKKVEATFGKLPEGNYRPEFPKEIAHSAPHVKVVEKQLPTNYIMGCFSTPGPNQAGYYAMTVAMDILRFRLFEEVRTKRNLSYAPSAGLVNNSASNGFIYVSAVSPDTTIKVMLAELKKLQDVPVSPKDLKDRITLFLTGYYLGNETNASQARFLASFELSGEGWQAGERFVDNVRKVTADEVQMVAKKYFHNLQTVVLGNPKLIDEKVFTSM